MNDIHTCAQLLEAPDHTELFEMRGVFYKLHDMHPAKQSSETAFLKPCFEETSFQIQPEETSSPFQRMAQSVFTDYIKLENGQLLKSTDQVRKTASLVNFSSNVQIGIFFMICKEIKIVKPQVAGTDFVKGLAALGIIQISGKEADRIADGFRLKVNGGKHRGKLVLGLASRHTLWRCNKDREFGHILYMALRMER